MTNTHLMVFESPRAHARISDIHALLSQQPMRADDLADAIGIKHKAIRLYLKHLEGQIHVACRDHSRGAAARMYAWGAEPGAATLPPQFVAPRPRKPRKRRAPVESEISPERLARIHRARGFKPQPVRRCPTVAMLFGEAGA